MLAQSVDTITVKMQPATFKQVVLYSADGAQQKYVTHAKSADGIFKLAVPADSPHAFYRLVFNQETMDYIDFLYLGKPFQVVFNPEDLNQLPNFINSDENNRFFNYLFQINGIQQKMDSVQISLFQAQDSNTLNTLKSQYLTLQKKLETVLAEINTTEKSELIKDVLKAHERVLPKEPIADPNEYLPFVKQHFFDHIDFNNPNLIHSSILVDKVMDYVFYLTVAESTEVQNDLYKKAINDVMQKVSDESMRKGFIQALIQSFSQDENVALTDYLFENYYDKLPTDLQNVNWKNGLQHELKTAISRPAPDFDLSFNGRNITLYDLKGYKYYIVVFWSTTCSHCMKEIPMFYDYIKDRKDTKVIAVGMETFDSQTQWKTEVYDYTAFVNVLGLGKWENPISQSYNVHATPNYFILDENKKIIAKPYDFEAVEAFFDTLK